jgi:hypothetical protein
MLGGVLGILLSPLATSAYYYEAEAGGWNEVPPVWVPPLKYILGSLLTFAPPADVYAIYGSGFFLVFLLFLMGLACLRANVGHIGRSGRWGFILAFVGLAMNLVGNVTDYWLGEKVLGLTLWAGSFAVFTLLGTLVLITGLVILGLAARRTQVLPRWSAWPLIILPPLGILLTFWGIKHIPSGTTLPLSITWILLGYVLWSKNDVPVEQPTRVR